MNLQEIFEMLVKPFVQDLITNNVALLLFFLSRIILNNWLHNIANVFL